MKVLIANKFYYRRGGDCSYAMALENLLKKRGYETAFFAMDYPQNINSPWKKYWPAEIGFSPKKPLSMLHAFSRPFGDRETKRNFSALLDDFKPDVVHLNNIHTQLSPVIAELAHRRGIRVVWTLHDYKLLCPAYTLYSKGKPCEDCLNGAEPHCFKKRCVKDSALASFIAEREARRWNRPLLNDITDAFICPSAFMARKMQEGGFAAEKLHILHNFIDANKLTGEKPAAKMQYCYVGRLSVEKGVDTLLSVAAALPYPLIVLGTGPLENGLRARYKDCANIEFRGQCAWEECKRVLAESKFSVISSEWYENNPLSVIESLSLGTPVLGADIGGIPELIEQGRTGELFESGKAESLASKIRLMFGNSYTFDRTDLMNRFSAEKYQEKLSEIYGMGND